MDAKKHEWTKIDHAFNAVLDFLDETKIGQAIMGVLIYTFFGMLVMGLITFSILGSYWTGENWFQVSREWTKGLK